MAQDLTRSVRQRVSLLLGRDTRVYVKDETILIITPRSFSDLLATRSKIIDILNEDSNVRKFKIILLDSNSIITNEIKRFIVLAQELYAFQQMK